MSNLSNQKSTEKTALNCFAIFPNANAHFKRREMHDTFCTRVSFLISMYAPQTHRDARAVSAFTTRREETNDISMPGLIDTPLTNENAGIAHWCSHCGQ